MGKKKYAPEEVLRAVSLVVDGGMSLREAERATGVSRETVRRWRGRLEPGEGSLYALAMDAGDGKEAPMDGRPRLGDLPDDPGELKRIIFDMQFEIDLTRAAVDILKKGAGADPGTLSNREKTALVDALSRKASPTGRPYTISFLTSSLRLARPTFYRLRKRIGEDPDADIRDRVAEACASHPGFGYRRVKRLLGAVSEKRVRRVMRQEDLQAARRRPSSRYSSYRASEDASELPNVPLREDGTHDFFADAPDRLWVTDVTEFALPCGSRVYLSPVLDCYDGSLPGWRISASARAADLTDPGLEAAVAARDPAPGLVLHTDRGGQYHARSFASSMPLRAPRDRALHVAQGPLAGQRPHGGVLRQAQDGVLRHEGLAGRLGGGVRRGAGPLADVLQRGEAEGVSGLDEPDAVQAGDDGDAVGCIGNCPHVPEVVVTPLA